MMYVTICGYELKAIRITRTSPKDLGTKYGSSTRVPISL